MSFLFADHQREEKGGQFLLGNSSFHSSEVDQRVEYEMIIAREVSSTKSKTNIGSSFFSLSFSHSSHTCIGENKTSRAGVPRETSTDDLWSENNKRLLQYLSSDLLVCLGWRCRPLNSHKN